MKTALFVLCLLAATAALGQSSGSAMMSSAVQMPNHAERASQQPLAPEQNLLEHSSYLIAQGERPLWEVQQASKSRPVPLGDIARMFRKDHELVKKADIVVHD
jgi:flagellar basal body L-ring protein FlgH